MAELESGKSNTKLAHSDPKSKFLKAISDRQQEVTEWARNGRPNIEFARQLGQLTENVTLDMMLNEQLLELSRARYKFKVNNRYDKKMFLQRQMRKSYALRDKLKDVQIEDKRPNWARNKPVLSRQQSIAAPPMVQEIATSPSPPPKKPHSSPSLRLKKPDSAPMRRKTTYVSEQPRSQTRNSLYENNKMQLTSSKDQNGDTSFFVTESVSIENTRREPITNYETPMARMLITPLNKSTPRDCVSSSLSKGVTPRPPLQPPKTAPEYVYKQASFLSQPPTSRTTEGKGRGKKSKKNDALLSWAQANREFNEKRHTADERYLQLERSLSQPYKLMSSNPGNRDVVKMIEALGLQGSKGQVNTHNRTRMTNKIRAMFAENQPVIPTHRTVPLKAY